MKTYVVTMNAFDTNLIETCARALDKIVRRWYNVYGGKLVKVRKLANGEYFIQMEYTAYWNEDGIWISWADIKRGWYHKVAKIDRNDEVEIHSW